MNVWEWFLVGVVITSESTADVNQPMLGSCPHSSNGCLLSLVRLQWPCWEFA